MMALSSLETFMRFSAKSKDCLSNVFYWWKEVLNVKKKKRNCNGAYRLYSFKSMTSSVFFHWFKLTSCLSSLFTACIINLLNLRSSFFARFISRTDGLFWKFSLWSFSVIKQLLAPSMSMRCSTFLSFRIFLPLMLIFFDFLICGSYGGI